MSDPSARPASELRVTANLLWLEPGTYCAFIAPDSAVADPVTGLPAVRLSAGPGPLSGRVSVGGLSGDGWLAGREDATLLRIAGGAAPALVTVYHGDGGDPPRLQVLRLAGEPSPAVAAAAPGPLAAMAHVYGRGDVGGRLGEWIGERGSRRWVEGFALQPASLAAPGDLEYQAVLGRDWRSPWVDAGQFCGSRGMALPILGFEARLRGAAAAAFDIVASATFVDGASAGPVRNGVLEAASLAALEAFHVTLEPKATPERRATGTASKRRT